MRIVALVSSFLLFLMFAFVAVLAHQAGDSHSTLVSIGVVIAAALFFAYELFELIKKR